MGRASGFAGNARGSFSRAAGIFAPALGHLAARAAAGEFCAALAASRPGVDDGGQCGPSLRLARTPSRRAHHFAAPARRVELAGVMLTALRYYWITAKGYRLRP